jgi:DNA repair exonuclease SbcCD nuclease subunit
MNNYLFFSDLHLAQNSIAECKDILEEILQICKAYEITQVFNLGDTFDKLYPSSEELDIFADFVKRLNLPIIILAANSHESTTHTDSVLNHFGLLKETVSIVKSYSDDGVLFCGHFIVSQSVKNYGGTVNKETLKQYPFVLLGHGHNPELVGHNIVQLGSVRFVDFGEDKTLKKQVALCTDYKGPKQKWSFLPLKAAIPMTDVIIDDSASKTQSSTAKSLNPCSIQALCELLDRLSAKTKIRLIFRDYTLWTGYLAIAQKYKEKFVLLAEKKEFVLADIVSASVKNETLSLKDNLISWLEKNNIDDKIRDILLEGVK